MPSPNPGPAELLAAHELVRVAGAEGEAFLIQATDGPADIRRGDAFDEIGVGVLAKMGLQAADRADRQAGAGGEEDVGDAGEVGQHLCAGVEGGLDDAEAAPFAGGAGGEADVGKVFQRGLQAVELILRGAGIDVDHHRAAMCGPGPGKPRGTGPNMAAR